MLNIKRVNIREKIHGINSVYIGRANKSYSLSPSILANPYVLGRDGDRDEVVEKYRKWLWLNVKRKLDNPEHGNGVFAELKRLQLQARKIQVDNIINFTDNSLILMCWCNSNEKCHGDIVINCLNWMEINHIGE